MANISDFILKQVTSAAGKVDIPSNVKDKVLGGLSDSIFGSLTQTAAKSGGVEEIKKLLTGKTDPAKSAVTTLATKLFTNNILKKLNLGGSTGSQLSAIIPLVVGKLSNFIKDQDGDGDVDINDIILSLKGSGSSAGLLSAATSLLGGLLGRKK